MPLDKEYSDIKKNDKGDIVSTLKESIKVKDGLAHLPSKPGLGIDFDWDFIDNSTFKEY